MKKSMSNQYSNNFLSWMESSQSIIAMRRGLLQCTPLLIIGSFCLVLTSFPVAVYQEWIRAIFNGLIFDAILWIHNGTMGSVTLFVVLAISFNYGSQVNSDDIGYYMITSIMSYIIFAAEESAAVSFDIFNATWLFTGIIVTLSSCYLFRKFYSISTSRENKKYQSGVDTDFHNTVLMIIPSVCVVLIFVVIKIFFVLGGGVNIQNIGSFFMMKLFGTIGTGYLGAFVYILLMHVLWFFGIHGSNMLFTVSFDLFEVGMLQNIENIANGGVSTHIFTKTFFDVFSLIGGCGTTICLLLALMIQRKKRDKTLFKIGIVPAIFNINEIVIFGLPIVFNPIMLIPFVTVPIVLMSISALSMYIGLVPIPIVQVTWTTPIFFSGYLSTGSIAGVILQVVLLIVGTLIYMPFFKIAERYNGNLLKKNVDGLKDEMLKYEERGETINFMTGPRSKRDIVKTLTKDLRAAMANDETMLYYQPQMNSDESVYGVEALLRWNHPVVGFLYPPLVIELARQSDLLDELGLALIEKAARDLHHLAEDTDRAIHMAVNILPVQFETETFSSRVREIISKYDFKNCTMCFEVTEQMALSTTSAISERIDELRDAGIEFHMDDFGMGHSSMSYLQSNEFEAVKLDGSLVRQMLDNGRSQNIISGIQQMSGILNYKLIAEYVETEEQKEMLKELGCKIYQGNLYSRPIPMEELETFLDKYEPQKES